MSEVTQITRCEVLEGIYHDIQKGEACLKVNEFIEMVKQKVAIKEEVGEVSLLVQDVTVL